MKNLYTENYKILLREIEEYTKKKRYFVYMDWKNQQLIWPYDPRQYTDLTIPMKIPMIFFKEIEEKIIRFAQNHKRLRIAKVILWKKNEAGGIKLPHFKLSYKATIIQMVLAEKQTHRLMEQNRELRNKPTCLWANNFWQRSQKPTIEKRKPLQ